MSILGYEIEEHDFTKGATHWVSPIGLRKTPKTGYYYREFKGLKRYFPNWARSNEWMRDNKNTEMGKVVTNTPEEYKEIEIPGTDGKYFLFYKGLK